MCVCIYVYIIMLQCIRLNLSLIRQNNDNNNNNNNVLPFYSVLAYLSAESAAGWPIAETAQHTNTNNKG